MAKRKKKKTKSLTISEKFLHYLVWILAAIASFLVLFLVGYYVGYGSAKKDIAMQLEKKEQQKKEALTKLQKVVTQKNSLNKKLEYILKKEQKKHDITALHEVEDKRVFKQRRVRVVHTNVKKPKLAIIFDDVSFDSHVKAIKALGLRVTMSFFPPSTIHPKTPKLASREPFYMVHLPMEALHFHKEEPFTLRANDSKATIQNQIAKIKKLFPRVGYINNHTGSKFTANYSAVKKLIAVLDANNIQFIDSRTTAQTKLPKLMQELHRPYMARDVFLDHKGDVASIVKQIKEAVKIARRYGSAIAIGHPHVNTIEALAKSKKLLQEVELVYVYELPK